MISMPNLSDMLCWTREISGASSCRGLQSSTILFVLLHFCHWQDKYHLEELMLLCIGCREAWYWCQCTCCSVEDDNRTLVFVGVNWWSPCYLVADIVQPVISFFIYCADAGITYIVHAATYYLSVVHRKALFLFIFNSLIFLFELNQRDWLANIETCALLGSMFSQARMHTVGPYCMTVVIIILLVVSISGMMICRC
jgi:hypothetical protein